MRVYAMARPFVLMYGGLRFVLSSDEAQRLLDKEDVVSASTMRVRLDGGATLLPATLGGGPAFEVVK